MSSIHSIQSRYASTLRRHGVREEQIARIGGMPAAPAAWRCVVTHLSHPHPHPHMIPGEDACGFCSTEVCRTSLGFAGARDPCRWVSGDAALDRYRHVAVSPSGTACCTAANGRR